MGQQLPTAPTAARSTRSDGAVDVGGLASVTIPRGQLRRPPVATDGVLEVETRSTTEEQRAALRLAGLRFDGRVWVGPDTPATRAAVERLCPWSAVPSQVQMPFDGVGEVVAMRPAPACDDHDERVRAGRIQQLTYESRRGGIAAVMAKQQLREMGAA